MKCICSSQIILAIWGLLTISLNAFSQIDKGQWLIGGHATYSNSKTKVNTNPIGISSFSLSPTAGYFFLNRLAGGLELNLGSETYHYQSGDKSRNNMISIGPFVRYYFLPSTNKINLFADAGYALLYGRYKLFDPLQPDYSYRNKILSFKAGPAIFLNKHTALEVTIGYKHSMRGPVDTVATNTIQIGLGLQIHFGRD